MYASLHVHDQFSNITTGLDSINKLDDLIQKAQDFGIAGLAITNHDNLCEVLDINDKQRELAEQGSDFKLLFGNEIYLINYYDDQDNSYQRYYHFILIAKDKIGYDALTTLSTKAWYRSTILRGRRRVPTLKSDVEEVMKWAKGHLIGATACLGSELDQLVINNEYHKAEKFIEWCEQQFGEDFYIELQPSDSNDQITFNTYAYKTWGSSKKFIITTDAHYQNAEDFPLFEAFLRSEQKNREVKEYYDFARLMTEEEILSLMSKMNIPEDFCRTALDNTLKIIDQFEYFDLRQDPRIPKVELPPIELNSEIKIEDLKNYPTLNWAIKEKDYQTVYCIRYCLNSLWERNLWNKQYLERLEEEFDVFKFQSESFHDNFFAYFNTMQHYIDLAWSIECAVGPSRGSASGSLLCYLMNVVQCDPLQYGLYFWRFANKVRTSVLDIDTDFQPSKRADLFEAIRKERGELGLTQVATYRTLTLKAAIGNAGRGYRSKDFPNGLDPDITMYLSSLIEIKRGFVASLSQTLNGDETMGYNVNHTFIKECKAYPNLLEIITKIEGLIVGSSTHAAAVILFDEEKDPITNHCSLMRAPNGDLCTSADLHRVEELGCYKYDFLLLSTLDIQAACFNLLKQHNVIDNTLTLKQCFRKYINPNTVDFNNPEIWKKLYNNEVLSVFQWDASSGRKGIRATQPHTLAELTAVNGLIRLMTVDGEEDQIERFVRIKNNPELFEQEMIDAGLTAEQRKIMHEELDRYNGCAATQESFMILSQRLANYSLKDADKLRKVVAKKKMNEIDAQKEFFFSKCEGSNKVKHYLWQTVIVPSLGYGSDKLGPYTLNALIKRVV